MCTTCHFILHPHQTIVKVNDCNLFAHPCANEQCGLQQLPASAHDLSSIVEQKVCIRWQAHEAFLEKLYASLAWLCTKLYAWLCIDFRYQKCKCTHTTWLCVCAWVNYASEKSDLSCSRKSVWPLEVALRNCQSNKLCFVILCRKFDWSKVNFECRIISHNIT